MAYFPFFIDIENKKGLIVGGGRIAAHKAEKMKPFGAKIIIIAPDIMEKLKQDPVFLCEERAFVPEDIEGCAFVIAATDDRELNHRISALCQEKGILINVVDDKLRGENDNKTIGLLLCKGKDEVVAQYALTGYDQPIGISDYQLSKAIPENLKSALPSIEEVEEELASFLDKDKNP